MISNTAIVIEKLKSANIPAIEKWLICLLVRNGLRISEITHCQNIKLIDNHTVSVWQPKVKEKRICQVIDYLEIMPHIFTGNNLTDWNRNRWYYYRLFDRLGISEQLVGHQNRSVTHLPRHQRANEVYNNTLDISLAAKSLGHRGLKSIKYYVKEPKNQVLNNKGILKNPEGAIEGLVITKGGIIYIRK